MKKVIHPCDVPMWNGKKYPMFCKITFEDGRLSIKGVIGPTKSGNATGGCGQIAWDFDHQDKSQNDKRYDNPIKAEDLRIAPGWNVESWYTFLEVWHDWHLNDMHSECEHQEKLGWTYKTHPSAVCPECGYKLGHGWTRRDVPEWVIQFLESLPDTDRIPNWV